MPHAHLQSIIDIPYTPLAPTPASRGEATPTASTPVASPPTSPFVLGSEEATLTSPFSTPSQSQLRSLEVSPFDSPPARVVDFDQLSSSEHRRLSPEVNQLPTPSTSSGGSPIARVAILPPAEPEPEHVSVTEHRPPSPSEDPFSPESLHAHMLAPSMSMHSQISSSSSALSFNTALSPATEAGSDYTALSPSVEFLSFPPTRAASPFSDPDPDAITLSPPRDGDDEVYLFSRLSGSVPGESDHPDFHVQSPPQSEDGFVLHGFDDDILSEGSGGWEEVDGRHVHH